jgi:NAD(P)-dependent dehydrogenase (short-subunit alcohol dehydrogenase family)
VSDLRLKNRNALVTGASRGIGKGIALELAKAGCNVAVNFFSETGGPTEAANAAQTVSKIQSLGREAFSVQGDVGSTADVNRMFDEVLKRFRRLDILVNNAGVQTWASLLDLKEADWDRDIRTNLKGCFLCTQAAARHMKQNSSGVIVNIGSGCNKLPFPRLVAYTASKGGIEMFTKSAAIELGPYSIRVNCIGPGAILHERTQAEGGDYEKIWGKATPLGRVGTILDVGQAVVFLASAESSYISGQTIYVDGGSFTKPNWPYVVDPE